MKYARSIAVGSIMALGVHLNLLAASSILFVGNSFTHYNNGIDFHFNQMAAATQLTNELHASRRTMGGQDFKYHYTSAESRDSIVNSIADFVIVQSHSYETIGDIDEFFTYGRLLHKLITDTAHKEMVLFMTWAYKDNINMIDTVAAAYDSLARELQVPVVSVGRAFDTVRREWPQMELFTDNKHPGHGATYLITCMFFGYFINMSPEGITYHYTLDPNLALYLQRTAAKTLQRFPPDSMGHYKAATASVTQRTGDESVKIVNAPVRPILNHRNLTAQLRGEHYSLTGRSVDFLHAANIMVRPTKINVSQ
ncbi:MAG: hypothetical protein GF398_03910 [Chitinivibrionales bacterium]|nr:hypothetical protein [Chitinivibrionales bacterium]